MAQNRCSGLEGCLRVLQGLGGLSDHRRNDVCPLVGVRAGAHSRHGPTRWQRSRFYGQASPIPPACATGT
jgi:hypothetical protein